VADWKAIIGQYGPIVWRIAYRLVGNHEDAADCFQDTFVAALKVSRRETVQNWPHLLARLATFRALDCLRTRLRRKTRSGEPVDWSALTAENPGPADRAALSELSAKLRKALTQLPRRQAEVLCLRHLEGMSDREISEQTGIKEKAVRVVAFRARARLRSLLGPMNEAEEF
jgi:RNA polymerase sigma-70 factor, ECF subfamily